MIEESVIIEKFLIFDTNIIWKVFDAVDNDDEQYSQWLDDVELFISHKKYNLFISSNIKHELETISKIRHLDRLFQEKRTGHPRINFSTTDEKHPLFTVLQKKFTGNKNALDEREAEAADHTLIIIAVELIKKHNQHPIQVVIYSNDWEVQHVTQNLKSNLPKEFQFTAPYISWKVGFQLITEMLLLKESLNLKSNLSHILDYTINDYYEWRKKYENNSQVIELATNSLKEIIKEYSVIGKRTEKLEVTVKELREKFVLQNLSLQEYQRYEQHENECEEKLHRAFEAVKDGNISDLEVYLDIPEIKYYSSVLKTYYEIVTNKVNKLHTYYKDWNKVFTFKNTYVNLSIQKELDKDVFKALVDNVIVLFKDNELNAAHVLSMELLPLIIAVQWINKDDRKYLEKFYVMGLYLSLFLENYSEYSEIIDLLQIAIEENICESELIIQHIEFACMIRDFKEQCSITYQFRKQMIQNIHEFYLARRWTLVWNLLLPLWKILTESEKRQLKEILVDAYSMNLTPPERFEMLWADINSREKIIKGENLGKPLLDTEAEKIVKGTVPDFLKGEHLVIDTRMIGRAHVIIYVKSKNSRFGIQIDSNDIDLSNANKIEFTDTSISQYFKIPNPDEKKHNISGIIKLTKEPNLKIVWKKVDLENIVI